MGNIKKQILIVDDEEEICDFLKEALEKRGFEITSATTGEEAIKIFSKNSPDLTIVDMNLTSTISGLELIRKCREMRPQAKIIAMTGYVDMKLKEDAFRLGVLDYLEKPSDIQPEVILGRIEKALGHKSPS